MAESFFTKFEGSEKKLKIILSSANNDLRFNKNARWSKVVEASKSQILSIISSENMDAYLLSESSLFVWEDKIFMITCGKTNLLCALSEILRFVNKNQIGILFYERKNFMYSQDQPSDFEDDVAYLNKDFPGQSFRFGPANCDHVHIFHSFNNEIKKNQYITLQVLMNDLDPSIIFCLCSGKKKNTAQLINFSEINSIYPYMLKDNFIFSPYGYSINGIYRKDYFTFHVTPQIEGSYASFETNVIEKDYSNTIRKIISVFKPIRFSIVLAAYGSDEFSLQKKIAPLDIFGYKIFLRNLCRFDCKYSVFFANYIAESKCLKWSDNI